VPEFRKAHTRDEADIAGSDHRDLHDGIPRIARPDMRIVKCIAVIIPKAISRFARYLNRSKVDFDRSLPKPRQTCKPRVPGGVAMGGLPPAADSRRRAIRLGKRSLGPGPARPALELPVCALSCKRAETSGTSAGGMSPSPKIKNPPGLLPFLARLVKQRGSTGLISNVKQGYAIWFTGGARRKNLRRHPRLWHLAPMAPAGERSRSVCRLACASIFPAPGRGVRGPGWMGEAFLRHGPGCQAMVTA
jgi:hypothetical protein